jgi:hypothetical protein
MHSIADTLAHVVYLSLGCNLRPGALKERAINIVAVAKQLSKKSEDCFKSSLAGAWSA